MLSSRIFTASDCIENAIITQHTITNTKIFRVVLPNILTFKLFVIPRLCKSVFFPATILSLLFLKFIRACHKLYDYFIYRHIFLQQKKPVCPIGKIWAVILPIDMLLYVIVYHKLYEKKSYLWQQNLFLPSHFKIIRKKCKNIPKIENLCYTL